MKEFCKAFGYAVAPFVTVLLFCLILIFFSSCNTFKDFNEDQVSLSSFDADYPSLEIYSQNKKFIHNGLLLVEVDENETIADKGISVLGYYSGNIHLVSNNCEIDYMKSYSDHRLLKLDFPVKIIKPCLVSINLYVDYDKDLDFKVSSFQGYVLFVPKKKTKSFNMTLKYREGSEKKVLIPFKVQDEYYDYYLSGCGLDESDKIENVKDHFEINLEDKNLSKGVCNLSIALVAKEEKLRARLLISTFDRKYQKIAIPEIEFKKSKILGKRISIKASNNVGVISVGDKYKIGDKVKMKYHSNDVIRLITSKGRLKLGKIINTRIEWID